MGWLLREHNVGTRGSRLVTVYDKEHKRDAYFYDKRDAIEAARIIEVMRTDSAFLNVEVIEE